jgi:hypothetical protein
VTVATGGGQDVLHAETGTGEVLFAVDVTGLPTPTDATSGTVTLYNGSRPVTIEIGGIGDSLLQSDLWYVHVIGQPQAVKDYVFQKRNRSLDVNHSTDQTIRIERDIVFPGRNITIEAGTVIINGAYTLSTVWDAGPSGNITIEGKHIEIDGGAILDARAGLTNGVAGDILIRHPRTAPDHRLGLATSTHDTDVRIGSRHHLRGRRRRLLRRASNLHFLLESDFGQNWVAQLIGGRSSTES